MATTQWKLHDQLLDTEGFDGPRSIDRTVFARTIGEGGRRHCKCDDDENPFPPRGEDEYCEPLHRLFL